MKSKDEQIREFERHNSFWKSIAILFIFATIAYVAVSVVRFNIIQDLEQQLESCQEKVSVWTFEFECEQQLFKKGTGFERGNISFPNYEDYKFGLDWFEDKDYCEVISG